MGDSALIRTADIEVLTTSIRYQGVGTDLFEHLGCNLRQKKLIVVKSSHHFYEAYSPRNIVYASTPGALVHEPESLAYSRINYPRWPLREHKSALASS